MGNKTSCPGEGGRKPQFTKGSFLLGNGVRGQLRGLEIRRQISLPRDLSRPFWLKTVCNGSPDHQTPDKGEKGKGC